MAQTDDILLSEPGEELQATIAGDFVVGDASNKMIKYIVLAAPGHYKMYPQVGVNIWSFVNSNAGRSTVERAIRLQLEADVFVRPDIDTRKFPVLYIDTVKLNIQSNGAA